MPLTLLVAATPQEQQQGYRGRSPPADDSSGILFFFREPARAVFNMRGVPFDLELCAGSADGTILGGSTMAANSTVEYTPSDPIRFAIELRAGWASRNGLPVRMSIP
jgi:hypothetical protein